MNSDKTGCAVPVLGIIGGLAITGGVIWSLIWVFANRGVTAGVLYLLFGLPIGAQLMYWLVMVVMAPILIAIGLLSRKD
jgi:hypothetical protein